MHCLCRGPVYQGQVEAPQSLLKACLGPQVTWERGGNLPHNISYPFTEGVNTLLPTPAVPKYHNLIFFLQPPVLMMVIKYAWNAVMPAYFVKFQIPFFKQKLFLFLLVDLSF